MVWAWRRASLGIGVAGDGSITLRKENRKRTYIWDSHKSRKPTQSCISVLKPSVLQDVMQSELSAGSSVQMAVARLGLSGIPSFRTCFQIQESPKYPTARL